MALEISEIAIQMRVDEDYEENDEEEEEDGKKKKKDKEDDGCCELDRQEIVDECVRRVMKMLRTKQER